MKYTSVYPITASQIDADYRLTVDGILAFYENTVARYFTTLNLAAFDLQKCDMTWVISEINLELPAPPSMWSEDIEIELWVSEMSSLRVWTDFVAREVHSGAVAARGNSCWSVISMSQRRPVSCEGFIPAGELRPELVAGPHRKRASVKIADTPSDTIEHRVNLIDLDFNGHTNNRRYVQLALSCFDTAFLGGHRPVSLGIRFIRESRFGEGLVCKTYPSDGEMAFVGIICNGSGEELCRVSSRWREKEAIPDIADVNLVRNPLG